MYDNRPKKDWLGAAVTAGLGAGVATSIAVSQGQNPMVACVITLFAIAAALVVDQFL